MNLDVNYRVTVDLTLSTMTVLPQTPTINPGIGVSADSSDDGSARRADVDRRDVFLLKQNRHHLDL